MHFWKLTERRRYSLQLLCRKDMIAGYSNSKARIFLSSVGQSTLEMVILRIVKGPSIYCQKWRVGFQTGFIKDQLRYLKQWFLTSCFYIFDRACEWIYLTCISFCFFRFLKDGPMVLSCGKLPLTVGIKY